MAAESIEPPMTRKITIVFSTALISAVLLTTAAQAKIIPNDRVAVDSSTIAEDAVLYSGPVGALLEANYFSTPRKMSNASGLCRLHVYFSSEPFRLARSCD
jgi:hypothetical protein